ncbi:BBE domain-containing protein [Romboutsia sp.]
MNFPLLQLSNYGCNYFGKNICNLKNVKSKYDPLNIFTFPQSIKSL